MVNNWLSDEIYKLLEKYPSLCLKEEQPTCYILCGDFNLNAEYSGVKLLEDFFLEIIINKNYPISLPEVFERKTIRNYPHKYSDGRLCLSVDMEIYLKLQNNPELAYFFDNFILTYLFSYKFYREYGMYPFGERSHGEIGVYEFYKEYFKVNTMQQASDMLVYLVHTKEYRGHHTCPCGS